MFRNLADTANADPNVRRLGRGCSVEFVLGLDERPFHVVVKDGVVGEVLEGPFKMRGAAFRIQAASQTWAEFMAPRPKPGFHDIFAMSATGNARIEGDMDRLLTHLAFFKALIATTRRGN